MIVFFFLSQLPAYLVTQFLHMPGAWALCSYPHVSTHPVIHRTQVLELQPHGEHPFMAGNYNPLPQRGLQSKSQFYFPCV